MKTCTWKWIALLLPVLVGNKTLGQETDRPFMFGIKAGLNYTHMNFDRGFNPNVSVPQTDWKTGVTGGFMLVVPLTGALSLQTEYLYSGRKAYIPASGTTLILDYLSLPVLLHCTLSPKFSILAGPQADLLIRGKRKTAGETKDITHDTEERNLGILGTVEYNFSPLVFIHLSYLHGLSNVGIGQRSDLVEFKYEMMSLSAGFRF